MWSLEAAPAGTGAGSFQGDRVSDRGSSQASAATLDVVGGVVHPGVDDAYVRWDRCRRLVGWFVGEDGWAGADGEHAGAVGSDGVDPSVDVASGAPSFSVFVPVVSAAFDAGVVLIGGATFVVLDGVVDLAEFGGESAAEVVALDGEEFGGIAGGPGEQAGLCGRG